MSVKGFVDSMNKKLFFDLGNLMAVLVESITVNFIFKKGAWRQRDAISGLDIEADLF